MPPVIDHRSLGADYCVIAINSQAPRTIRDVFYVPQVVRLEIVPLLVECFRTRTTSPATKLS
jgi:hypothetical protein